MSKNITIKQDGTPKNFNNVEMTRTDKQGGGSVDWVPEDETKLGIKVVTDNGEYKAEDDGLYGYSEVRTEGLYESKDVKTKSKSIDANGTYYSGQEGLYGYSTVYVRVRGGGSYTNPDTGDKETPEPGIDNGCAITGKDEDGDDAMVIVEDGKLDERKMADHILLDTPPNKLVYVDGERITLAGAVVRGYLADGRPYKNSSYADSVLPFHQYGNQESGSAQWLPGGIVFPTPLYADASESGGTKEPGYYYNEVPLFNPFSTSQYMSDKIQLSNETTVSFGGCTLTTYYSNDRWRVTVEKPDGTTATANAALNGRNFPIYAWIGITVDGNKSVTNAWIYFSTISVWPDPDYYSAYDDNETLPVEYARYDEGGGTGTQTITLTWPREGDRKMLTTTFEITIGDGSVEWTKINGKKAQVVTEADGTQTITTTEDNKKGGTTTTSVTDNSEGVNISTTTTDVDSFGNTVTTTVTKDPESGNVIGTKIEKISKTGEITTSETMFDSQYREWLVTTLPSGKTKKERLFDTIGVSSQPKKRSYKQGEPINLSGMVAFAGYLTYEEANNKTPINPNELTYDQPLIADKNVYKDDYIPLPGRTSKLDTNWEQPLWDETSGAPKNDIYRQTGIAFYDTDNGYYNDALGLKESVKHTYFIGGLSSEQVKKIRVIPYYRDFSKSCITLKACVCSDTPNAEVECLHIERSERKQKEESNYYNYKLDQKYKVKGKTVYYKFLQIQEKPSPGRFLELSVVEKGYGFSKKKPDENTIWTAVYGSMTYQYIEYFYATWKRPGDGKVLDTFAFEIRVTD